MRISKNRIQQIIREECGMAAASKPLAAPIAHSPAPAPLAAPAAVAPLAESDTPELEMVMEMDQALKALDVVVECVQAASSACVNCVSEVSAQAPLLDAAATQATALKEMLEAQVEVMAESVEAKAEVVSDAAQEVQLESLKRRIRRTVRRNLR